MAGLLRIGDIRIQVVRKSIRHVHLSVYPPDGHVHIAAPERSTPEAIRLFAISKLGWIRRQQRKLRGQERESPREFLERETHYLWGERRLLKLVEYNGRPKVDATPRMLVLHVRARTGKAKREALVQKWLRQQLRQTALALVAYWEPRLDVEVKQLYIQRMKTKWGSCNAERGSIRVNSTLVAKPRECLEYIVVHELLHLRERRHSERFRALMGQALPRWQSLRNELNRAPLAHETWTY
ncbi:MAG TPA: SprT family zinc-dependent metalloprotease [Candidatus Acidoferrales bacterium]|nr:SprT family zinc-dependent metalloprotease [Candidatus Acidoferrales bacterium]